jgi:peptidyl-prolyl cis-trans isomerase C
MRTDHTNKAALTAIAALAMIVAVSGCQKKEEAKEKSAEACTSCPDHSSAIVSEPVRLDGVKLPDTVVTVNGEKLMRADVEKELAMMEASPQFAAMPPEQAQMFRQQMQSRMVDRFVNQQVLGAEADKQNVVVTDLEIDEMLENIRGSLPPGTTLEQVIEERGLEMAKLRSDISVDLKIRSLLEKQAETVPEATEEAIAAFYEEQKEQFNMAESAHARHILVKVDPTADDAAKAAKKAEIEGYRQQLAEGTAEFEKLASEHSDCPSGQRGGDLGTFERGRMVPEFETAAFEQEIDAIGPVIETQFGYHIIQVLERAEAGQRAFEDVKEEIAQQLTGRSKQQAVEAYIASLREQASITYGD